MNKAVIFDLDGTLVDSAGGIAYAVNKTREFFHLPMQNKELISSFIGNGIARLMKLSLADDETQADLADVVQYMNTFYAEHPLAETTLYPGVTEGLQELAQNNWLLFVVSNKRQMISEKILSGLGIREFFDENIGDGGNFPLKPAPDALYFIMEKYQIDPEKCFVLGDNYTDIDFAVNSGVKSIFASWGIGSVGKNLPDAAAEDFSAAVKLITGK